MDYYRKPYGTEVAEIINYLSEIRKSSGISIRTLAADMGVYPNAVQNWLNPNKNSSLDNIVSLGNHLGVTFSMSNTRKYDCSADELINCLLKAKEYQELNTREIAEMTGITQPSVAGILGHRIMPRLNAFLLIATALELELELYTE